MLDNTDESSENQAINRPDTHSDNIILAQEAATVNQNQETANMEVHHIPIFIINPKNGRNIFLSS